MLPPSMWGKSLPRTFLFACIELSIGGTQGRRLARRAAHAICGAFGLSSLVAARLTRCYCAVKTFHPQGTHGIAFFWRLLEALTPRGCNSMASEAAYPARVKLLY